MRCSFLLILCIATAASAQLREWSDYRTVLWMSGKVDQHKEQWPLIARRMKELGINTGMAGRDDVPARVLDSGFGYYVENIVRSGLCLKFNSKVTNWSKFVDEWAKTRSAEAFVRDHCFDDPKWLGIASSDVIKAATAHAATKPLMYDLRDELSVTISANPFDYDFSPLALAGFREWLKTQYKDLAALNAQWDTEFKAWDDVMPFSTDQIKRRMVTGEKHPQGEPDWSALKQVKFTPAEAAKNPVRWNFSPWCDHRTYMDISLARTLGALRDAARTKDPHTPVGIEGLQMPSAFGGYDLWRLSQVLDWAEPYDVGNSREILGSFMEGKPMVCTVFEKDTDHARRRLWHLLLLGDRGCIVWWSDDVIDWTKPELPLTDKGRALAPVLRELQSPLARLFIKAKREWDPITIHYSQPSIQVAWLLESVADGKTWPRRFSSFEATHNQHAQARNSWLKLLQDLGYSPRFEVDEANASVLPQTLAGKQAPFDSHGRFVRAAPMDTAFPYASERLSQTFDGKDARKLADQMMQTTVPPPPIRVPVEARVRTHRFTLGEARLLAFERNIDYKMSEDLAQAGGNEQLEKPVSFAASWNEEREVYDLRTGRHLGRTNKIEVNLDPWQPSLFALLPKTVDGDVVEALSREK